MTLKNDVTIFLNEGSDIFFALEFTDDAGAPLDMTGHTISIFAAETWGLANGSVAWVDQAAGIARISAPWAASPPAETWFRISVWYGLSCTVHLLATFFACEPKAAVGAFRWGG